MDIACLMPLSTIVWSLSGS